MEFKYGISPDSLRRWALFERISAVQAERGPDVGWAAMTRLVDSELEAIEQATLMRQDPPGWAVRPNLRESSGTPTRSAR